jgi:superfamily II DNA or RNA helicase
MRELILRTHQEASVAELRDGYRNGHNAQLVSSPTGSGKGIEAVYLAKASSAKGTRTAFLVDRIALVDQISATLSEYGVDHGVIQADHWRFRPQELVQVISTATLARRDLSDMGKFSLCLWDEAHVIQQSALKFIADNPQMKICGLTATPFHHSLGSIYSRIVTVTTHNQLIVDGVLAPMKVYACRPIDTKGLVPSSLGEWVPTDIEKRSMAINGDIVDGWIEKTTQHFGGPVKTILFSATVAHGEELCRRFQELGYNFQQASYLDGNNDNRRALISEFRKPDSNIVGLVSVDALGRGFDVPDILCMVTARPFRKSMSAWIQQIGRGMRSFPGKDYVLLLDNTTNFIRFQPEVDEFFEHGLHDLGHCDLDKTVRKEPDERTTPACKGCGYILSPKDTVCPSCGMERPRRANHIQSKPGVLVEVGKVNGKIKENPPWMNDTVRAQREILGAALEFMNGDREKANKFALPQYKGIFGNMPPRYFKDIDPVTPSREVHGAVMHTYLKWKYGKGKSQPRPK